MALQAYTPELQRALAHHAAFDGLWTDGLPDRHEDQP